MTETEVILVVLTIIGSLLAFYKKLKKDIVYEHTTKSEPIEKLNESIVQLNSTIGFLTQMIETLKLRVANHGSEIDDIRLQNQSHEERIRILEKHCEEYNK